MVLYIFRGLIIKVMGKGYNLPSMRYVDQQALGVLFAIFCICISVFAIYKFHKNKTIISDEYVSVQKRRIA